MFSLPSGLPLYHGATCAWTRKLSKNKSKVEKIVNGILMEPLVQFTDQQKTLLTGHHAAQLFEQLCALHTVGFLHRDVRPENILITPDGKEIVLCGFGSAVPIDHPDTEWNLEGGLSCTSHLVLSDLACGLEPSYGVSDDLESALLTLFRLHHPPFLHMGGLLNAADTMITAQKLLAWREAHMPQARQGILSWLSSTPEHDIPLIQSELIGRVSALLLR